MTEREEGQAQSSPESERENENRSPESEESRSPESENSNSGNSPPSDDSRAGSSPPSDDSRTSSNGSLSNGSDSGSPLPAANCVSSSLKNSSKNKRIRNAPSCPKEMVHNWRLKPQNIVEITLMQPDDFSNKKRDHHFKKNHSVPLANGKLGDSQERSVLNYEKQANKPEESYSFHLVNPNNKTPSHGKRNNNNEVLSSNSSSGLPSTTTTTTTSSTNGLTTPSKEGRDEKKSRPSNPPVDGDREQVQKTSQKQRHTTDKHRHSNGYHTHSHTHTHTHNHNHNHTHHHIHRPTAIAPPQQSTPNTADKSLCIPSLNPPTNGRFEDTSGAALLEHFRRSFDQSREAFAKEQSEVSRQGKMAINNLIDST